MHAVCRALRQRRKQKCEAHESKGIRIIAKAGPHGFSAVLLPAKVLGASVARTSTIEDFLVCNFTMTSRSNRFLELKVGPYPAVIEAAFLAALNAAFLDDRRIPRRLMPLVSRAQQTFTHLMQSARRWHPKLTRLANA